MRQFTKMFSNMFATMTHEVSFFAHYGYSLKWVKLVEPNGMPGGYQIYIDQNYHGMLAKRSWGWVLLGKTTEFTSDDIQAMGERIDEDFTR